MPFGFDEMDAVDKFFTFYVFFYLMAFILTYASWVITSSEESASKNDKGVVEDPPKSGAF